MKNTANYNLKKPDAADKVNIQDINDNMNILDEELKDLSSLIIKNQSSISNLAGTDRTIETVKKNADDITRIKGDGDLKEKADREYVDMQMTSLVNELNGPKQPFKKVCLYYGYPININDLGDIDKCVDLYCNYDIVIFGGEYEHPAHDAYDGTVSIIEGIRNKKSSVEVFGYLPIGLEPNSYTSYAMEILKQYIDEWYDAGATGVFLDEFGFDYCVTRERQNEIVNYCHSKGLNTIANSWSLDYVFSSRNDIIVTWVDNFNGNPNGVAPVLSTNDYYMFKPLFYDVNNGTQIVNDNWQVYQAVIYRQDVKAEYGKSYSEQFGVRTIALDSIRADNEDKEEMFAKSYFGSYLLGIDCYGASIENLGESNSNYIHYDYSFKEEIYSKEKPVVSISAYNGEAVTQFSAIINGHSCKLIWYPDSDNPGDITKGVHEIYYDDDVRGFLLDSYRIKENEKNIQKLLDSSKGISNFVGAGNEVTIAHSLDSAPTFVSITPMENPNGTLEEFWCRFDDTNIYVGNSGSFTGQFCWIAYR